MSEAVTMPSLMTMTLIVSEESLARDRHTQTDRHGLVYANFFKVLRLWKEQETRREGGEGVGGLGWQAGCCSRPVRGCTGHWAPTGPDLHEVPEQRPREVDAWWQYCDQGPDILSIITQCDHFFTTGSLLGACLSPQQRRNLDCCWRSPPPATLLCPILTQSHLIDLLPVHQNNHFQRRRSTDLRGAEWKLPSVRPRPPKLTTGAGLNRPRTRGSFY